MDISKLIENYTSVDELKIFCAAQAKQIQTLNKKIKEMEDEVAKAKKASKELVKTQGNLTVPGQFTVLDDAKTIAQIQLNLLKEKSFEQELDSDEAKRVELYNRILKDEVAKKDPVKATVEITKSEDLLKLVDNG